MKFIYIAAMAITLLCACQRKAAPAVSVPASALPSLTDKNGSPMLLGVHHKEDLQQLPYGDWFNKNYADYTIDSAIASQLKPLLKNKQLEIYMGTWCGDSRREVPRMYKILEFARVHPSQVKLVLVDNHDSAYKQSPTHEEKGKNIHRVPDLVVYDRGKELNRIIEHPVVSLEKDLLRILNHEAYEPAYAGANYLAHVLQQTAVVDKRPLADTLKKLVQHTAELNSLGYVWMAAGEYSKAMIAFEMNAAIYPGAANVYDGLAAINLKLNNKDEAKKCYRKILELQPGNANAIKMLQTLE